MLGAEAESAGASCETVRWATWSQVPYLRQVAAAHSFHHINKFGGVPYGLFLGPQELAAVGGLPDLEHRLAKQDELESMPLKHVAAKQSAVRLAAAA